MRPADTSWVQRISVIGNSGSGKTTLARRLAAARGVPHLELDSVFHQADWQPLDTEEFRAVVSEFTAGPAWIVDGNYSVVRDIVWSRADTVVWIDPPRHTVMRRLLARTFRRMATGVELWNGNRERFRFLFNRDESIILWAWTHHDKNRAEFVAAQADSGNSHLEFIRLRTDGQAEALVRSAAARALFGCLRSLGSGALLFRNTDPVRQARGNTRCEQLSCP
jgi:adenylate kinase family enzyme